MKTYSLKGRDITHDWHVIDAADQTLGRLATQVAILLRGKHKPVYSPHLDMGDYVIVVNADKIRVTGRKRQQKIYYRHSTYPGGLKMETLEKLLARQPARVIERAVKGMLPHNRLGRAIHRHLKVYAGPDHPHEAQVRASEKRHQAEKQAAEQAPTPPPEATGQPPVGASPPPAEEAKAAEGQAAET
jgi:large subunit ribosomal protein L13